MVNSAIYSYRQSCVFTVWLEAGPVVRMVEVYDRSTSGHKTLLKTLWVRRSTGKTTVRLQVTKNAYLRAEFAGDSAYQASADEENVQRLDVHELVLRSAHVIARLAPKRPLRLLLPVALSR